MLPEPGAEQSPPTTTAEGDVTLVTTTAAEDQSRQCDESRGKAAGGEGPDVEPCEEAEEPAAAVKIADKIDDIPTITDDPTLDDPEVNREIVKQIVEKIFQDKPPMNHSDTKDSLSSVDSLSLNKEEDNNADLSDAASDDAGRKRKSKDADAKAAEEETEFVPPDDELAQKIVDQVEFYFSDVNITKDAFLLKHVKRNKEGYVSLKLISSFKRVKHLAKDWRVVAYALAKSKKLEINEAGTKLRRVDPLPAYDQTTPSRTVVAVDLPLEKPTIENVAEMFKSCGEIALIRILRPGNPIPADVRHFVNKHPEMIGKISALVEFVRTESAHNAIQKEWSWRQDESVKVIELNAPPSVDKKKKAASSSSSTMGGKKMSRSGAFDLDYSSSSELDERRMHLTRRCSSPQLHHHHHHGGHTHEGAHWHQRRWSRDSGTDSSVSSYSRSRSNSGVFYMPDSHGHYGHGRRMSTDSCGGDSFGSRSRSNSGVSVADIRRLSIASKDSNASDCCCCHGDCGSRRGSRDSGSEGYGSSRSRCNSGASDIRRNSMEFYCSSKVRERRYQDQSGGGFWSSSGGSDPRRSDHSKPVRAGVENVVRMPRGPDGGRGFVPVSPPACHTLIE